MRISYRRTRDGWKPRFKAYFGDTRYGGKAKAFAAAEAWLRAVTETGRAPKEATPPLMRARGARAAKPRARRRRARAR
ncbi:MAG TPA: hypothetical protein VMG41_02120 [Gemmatimonadales bacterium]|nr:hypothetical protein [Gemmatimonadales bacterium]